MQGVKQTKKIKGTTISSYQNVHTVNTGRASNLTLLISNTGSSKSLKYKIYTYAQKDSDNYIEYTAETTLASGSTNEEVISNTAYDKIEVYLKNGDGITDWELTTIKQR